MATESRSRFVKNYTPGLFACATEAYTRNPETWREICAVRTSKRQYEESSYKSGLGYAVEKAEGTAVTYDARIAGHTKRWTHKTIALGMRITEEAIEDDMYGDMQQGMKELGISLAEKNHVDIADIFNSGLATVGTRLAGDGLSVFNASHVRLDSSTYDNTGTAADLTYAVLWTNIQAYENLRDHRGKRINRRPRALLIPPALEVEAHEILYSPNFPSRTVDASAVSAMKRRSLTLIVWPYLTDSDSWFLLGEKDDQFGLIHFIREKTTFAKDSDFATGDALFKGRYRSSTEVNSPMNLWGNPGA